jgi:hypothetical protein
MPMATDPKRRRVARRWRTAPEETSPELNEDMCPNDIVWVLERLRGRCQITLDSAARDYLVDSVKAHVVNDRVRTHRLSRS